MPAEELRGIAARLRDQHGRARDLLRAGRRARSGKGEARAASSASHEKLAQKKQVFAAALKRVNARFAELDAERVRAERRAALRAALARRQALKPTHPSGGFAARSGMRDKPSGKGHAGVHGARIGSVSQQNKRAQAQRDG